MKSLRILFLIIASPVICLAQQNSWRISSIDEAYGLEVYFQKPSVESQRNAAELTLIERKQGKYKKFKYSFDNAGNVKSKIITPYLEGKYYVLGECIVNDIKYIRMQMPESFTVFLLPKSFVNKEMLRNCYSPLKISDFFHKYRFIEQKAYNDYFKIDEYHDRGREISINKPYHRFGEYNYVRISIKELNLEKGAITLTNYKDAHFQNPTFDLNDIESLVKGHALVTEEEIDSVKQVEMAILDSVKSLYNPRDNFKEGDSYYHKKLKNGLAHLVGQEIMYCGLSNQYSQGAVYIIDSVTPNKNRFDGNQLYISIKNTRNSILLQSTGKSIKSILLQGKDSELNKSWVVLSHLKYLKDSLVGREYIYNYERDSYGAPIKQVGSNKPMKEVPSKSVWICVDVLPWLQIGDRILYFANPVIILQNEKYGKGYCFQHVEWPKEKEEPVFGYRMIDKQEYDAKIKAEQKAKQERIAKLTAKYGKYYAKLIVEEKVVRGMTKEMCRESWGEPDDINVSIGSWGRHEQWVYGKIYSSYLYFENGKLTTIQD